DGSFQLHLDVYMMIRGGKRRDRRGRAFKRRGRVFRERDRLRRMVRAADIDDILGLLLGNGGVGRFLAVPLCIPLFLPKVLGALVAFDTAYRIQMVDSLDIRAQITRLYRHNTALPRPSGTEIGFVVPSDRRRRRELKDGKRSVRQFTGTVRYLAGDSLAGV